jgi:histidinol dehydrogenase
VYDFVKRSNVITAGELDGRDVAPYAERIADFEGLPLHGRSVMVRTAVRS